MDNKKEMVYRANMDGTNKTTIADNVEGFDIDRENGYVKACVWSLVHIEVYTIGETEEVGPHAFLLTWLLANYGNGVNI